MIPLKAVRTPKKKNRQEENHSFQREPTWEYMALSGSDSILYARCNQSHRKPLKRGISPYQQKNLTWTGLILLFDHQPDQFRSRRAHQWLNGDHGHLGDKLYMVTKHATTRAQICVIITFSVFIRICSHLVMAVV